MEVYLRVPMPYLVASLLGPEQSDGSREAAPFTTNEQVDGELMHRVDMDQLLLDAQPLGQLAAQGHNITITNISLVPVVGKVRVYSGNTQPPFSTLEEAIRAFEVKQPLLEPPPFVGDAVVDVHLHFPTDRVTSSYGLSSSLNPGLPGQEDTANLVLDYQGAEPRVYRITGLMHEPVEIDRSAWAAAKTFIAEGVKHILGGYDHVLFVACLVLGTLTLIGLAWRVTGFTLGHSITLTLGFFGFAPAAEWFIPLVETGIAVSIVYAAVYALNQTPKTNAESAPPKRSQWSSFVVTALIGMLHGLGFSFVLKEILGVTSSNIWVSLLSFNVGVELGQLGIVSLIWPILWIVNRYRPEWNNILRWSIALPCIAVASVWTGQRAIVFLATLQGA